MNKILLFIFMCFSLRSVSLDIEKIYTLTEENCIFHGHTYKGSCILDLSNMGIDDLTGISILLVKYNKKICPLASIKRLYIKLADNKLKTIPKEITKLDLVALDLVNNAGFELDQDIKKKLKKCYFYLSYKDFFTE